MATKNESAAKNILIADNDISALESVAFLLASAQYNVFKADSVESCEEMLARNIIHAAVIDMRLTDNHQVDDVSGFTVAKQLSQSIPCIIYTAYQDIDNLRAAVVDVGAKNMVDKSANDASENLLKAVDSLFAEHVHINFALEINGDVEPESVAEAIQLPDSSLIDADSADIVLILRMLFPDAEAITLEPLLKNRITRSKSKSRSVVLCVTPYYTDGGAGAPMVVKFGASSLISQEEQNYGALKRFIGGARLTILEEAAYSREIGALCFRLFGRAEPQRTVSHLYDLFTDPETAPEEVAALVRNFFDETFAGIYRWAEPKTIDIFTHYAARLDLNINDLTEAIHDLIRNDDRLTPSVEDGNVYWTPFARWLPEPAQWVAPDGGWRSMLLKDKECLCHGDLHSRNLLVDSTMSLWLIDFERVAQSHWLRDYIELETDLKFQLEASTTLDEFLTLECGLFYILDGSPNQHRDAVAKLNPKAKRTYRVINQLRRDACQRFELEQEPLGYYCALLISTLNVMQLKSTSLETMEQAYLSAALLCQRIEQEMQ